MSGLTWTRAVFIWAAALQVTASVPSPAAVVELGSHAVLPCPGLRTGSDCGGVSWVFRRSQDSMEPGQDLSQELVQDGQSVDGSGRTALLSNCSLLLRSVREEDAGLYSCSSSRSAAKRGLPSASLSVLRAVGRNVLGEVAGCVLSSPESSRFRLRSFGLKRRSKKTKRPWSINNVLDMAAAAAGGGSPWCSVTDKLSGRVWPFTITETDAEETTSHSHRARGSGVVVAAVVLSALLLFT